MAGDDLNPDVMQGLVDLVKIVKKDQANIKQIFEVVEKQSQHIKGLLEAIEGLTDTVRALERRVVDLENNGRPYGKFIHT